MLAVYGVYAVYGLCTGIACICVYGPVYTGYRPVYAIPAIPYISLYRYLGYIQGYGLYTVYERT